MATLLRRLFWLALIGGGAFAAWSWWQRQRETAATPAPEWPTMEPPDQPSADQPTAEPEPIASETRWVEPVDGGCPDGYPIKANDNSGIYHLPGGRFYDRTVPERCYASADDAEADGYRAAKA